MYSIKEARRDARRHVLTRTEEIRLHAAYLAGDHAAGQRLVNSFLPVLSRSAYAYEMPRGHGEDMLGVAVQAFMENLFRYDPATSYRIWTYMHFIVKHAVSRYAYDNRSFFRTTQNDRTAFTHFNAEKKKLGACGRPLTGSEARHMASEFGVPESVIHGFDDDMAIMRPGPINGEWKAEACAVEDPERDGGHLDFERRHDHDLHMELLGVGIDLLDERQREVMTRRFKEMPDTLQEIADDMGLSRERIRQIEGIALRILRHAIENPGKRKPANASLIRRYDDGRSQAKPGGVKYVESVKHPNGRKTAKPKGRRCPGKAMRRRDAAVAGKMRAQP